MKIAWIITFFVVLVWSGIAPKDYPTWALEVSPAVIGLIVLAATYRGFPLTTLLYALILVHCIVLMVGSHYTYAEVPLFEYLKPVLGFERNNFDKLGHFYSSYQISLISMNAYRWSGVPACPRQRATDWCHLAPTNLPHLL